MTDPCTNEATYRRFWPGREPDAVCAAHKEDGDKIAAALGTSIHHEPIGKDLDSGDAAAEPVPCACSKGHVQTVRA